MKIWKKILIGTHKSKDELLKALNAKNIQVTDSKHIWDSPDFQLNSKQEECNLVRVLVDDLGFKEPALYKDICEKAQEFGLKLCPAEVGPQLKLQYKQRRGEYLSIGMNLMQGGYFRIVFGFDYDIQFLRANTFNPLVVKFELDEEFIFCVD